MIFSQNNSFVVLSKQEYDNMADGHKVLQDKIGALEKVIKEKYDYIEFTGSDAPKIYLNGHESIRSRLETLSDKVDKFMSASDSKKIEPFKKLIFNIYIKKK